MPKTTPSIELARDNIRDLAGEVCCTRMAGQLPYASRAADLADLISEQLAKEIDNRGDAKLHEELRAFSNAADKIASGIRDAITDWHERTESIDKVTGEVLGAAMACLAK